MKPNISSTEEIPIHTRFVLMTDFLPSSSFAGILWSREQLSVVFRAFATVYLTCGLHRASKKFGKLQDQQKSIVSVTGTIISCCFEGTYGYILRLWTLRRHEEVWKVSESTRNPSFSGIIIHRSLSQTFEFPIFFKFQKPFWKRLKCTKPSKWTRNDI